MPTNPQPLQFHRGPYPPDRTLLNAEPCDCSILLPDGSSVELLYVGGRDGTNHLQGGGLQTIVSPPTWIPPTPGIALFDSSSLAIWVSNATGGWVGFFASASPNNGSFNFGSLW